MVEHLGSRASSGHYLCYVRMGYPNPNPNPYPYPNPNPYPYPNPNANPNPNPSPNPTQENAWSSSDDGAAAQAGCTNT